MLHIIKWADVPPPECRLHSSVEPENAFLSNNLFNNIYWARESACFILQPAINYEHRSI
jgi:hypothetical protein